MFSGVSTEALSSRQLWVLVENWNCSGQCWLLREAARLADTRENSDVANRVWRAATIMIAARYSSAMAASSDVRFTSGAMVE